MKRYNRLITDLPAAGRDFKRDYRDNLSLQNQQCWLCKLKGFTLIELIVVVVIIVILVIFAAPKFGPYSGMYIDAAADRIATDFRYVQQLAITHGNRAGLIFDINFVDYGGYEVIDLTNHLSDPCNQTGTWTDTILDPLTRGILVVDLRGQNRDYGEEFGHEDVDEIEGVYFTTSFDPKTRFEFDRFGIPYSGDCKAISATLAIQYVKICQDRDENDDCDEGSIERYVCVEPETGKVSIGSSLSFDGQNYHCIW